MPNDFQRVWEHLLNEFFPAEPCFRSIGCFKEENLRGSGTKLFTWMFKLFIKSMLKNGTSVIALNEQDQIVGSHYKLSFFINMTINHKTSMARL